MIPSRETLIARVQHQLSLHWHEYKSDPIRELFLDILAALQAETPQAQLARLDNRLFRNARGKVVELGDIVNVPTADLEAALGLTYIGLKYEPTERTAPT